MTRALKDRRSGRLGFFRRLGRSNRLFPRKLRLNTEGKFLVFLTIGIGFAAINTGNNLLYLVLGMLLSLIIVSGILSELALRDVSVRREIPDGVSAGRDVLVAVRVKNRKRFFSSFSVEVEEVFDGARPWQLAAYALHLRPGEEATVHMRLRFAQRGEYTTAGLNVATRFPFSFFRKSRYLPGEEIYLVYPPVRDVKVPTLPPRQSGSDQTRPRIGHGDEIYGVRDYRPGDAARDIHWKLTARRGRLIAREFETPAVRTVMLSYPNAVRSDTGLADLEQGIVHVASVASALLDRGYAVGLLTLDGTVAPGREGRHRDRLFAHLARLRAYLVGSDGKLPGFELPSSLHGIDRILVRPHGQGRVRLNGTFDQEIVAEPGEPAQGGSGAV